MMNLSVRTSSPVLAPTLALVRDTPKVPLFEKVYQSLSTLAHTNPEGEIPQEVRK